MASRSFQSSASNGFILNRTGTRTPLRTLLTATDTDHPSRECEGYNGTRGGSRVTVTGPLQNRSPVSAIGIIYKNFSACSSATILQPLIATGHLSGYHNSRSNKSVMSTHTMTALPSMRPLPPYFNATGLPSSHSSGGTSINSSNLNETCLKTSVPPTVDHRVW